MAERIAYDEFSMFQDNASEYGITYTGPPVVRRERADLGDGRSLSALVWGTSEPEFVFLHGGAQNAHTWDTVLLALGRPALAVDLPGHGHSDGGRAGYLNLSDNADDVATTIRALAPDAKAVIGMSLGGMAAIALSAAFPDLVRKLVLVDITPGVNREKSSTITAFINGPESFPDFDAILARTVQFNPTRTEASLRRGILHNAEQREDGTWVWRYARHRALSPLISDQPAPAEDQPAPAGGSAQEEPFAAFNEHWESISALKAPVMLVRGMLPQSVVDDADEAELLRRQPAARIEHVAHAGHSVQGDAPVELAGLIVDFAG